MQISLFELNGSFFAEIQPDQLLINSVQDAVDVMMDCYYQGADLIVLKKSQLTPDFFDLKTKLAGEILQKFSTYRIKLAIVGDFSGYTSKSLQDFIHESNQGKHVNFVRDLEAAKSMLVP